MKNYRDDDRGGYVKNKKSHPKHSTSKSKHDREIKQRHPSQFFSNAPLSILNVSEIPTGTVIYAKLLDFAEGYKEAASLYNKPDTGHYFIVADHDNEGNLYAWMLTGIHEYNAEKRENSKNIKVLSSRLKNEPYVAPLPSHFGVCKDILVQISPSLQHRANIACHGKKISNSIFNAVREDFLVDRALGKYPMLSYSVIPDSMESSIISLRNKFRIELKGTGIEIPDNDDPYAFIGSTKREDVGDGNPSLT